LSNGAFVVIGDLVGSVFEVDVDALFADVDFAVGEPAVEVEVVDAEGGGGESVPVNVFGLVFPVSDGILQGEGEGSLIGGSKAGDSLQKHILSIKL
jgi:hypothetical protein